MYASHISQSNEFPCGYNLCLYFQLLFNLKFISLLYIQKHIFCCASLLLLLRLFPSLAPHSYRSPQPQGYGLRCECRRRWEDNGKYTSGQIQMNKFIRSSYKYRSFKHSTACFNPFPFSSCFFLLLLLLSSAQLKFSRKIIIYLLFVTYF